MRVAILILHSLLLWIWAPVLRACECPINGIDYYETNSDTIVLGKVVKADRDPSVNGRVAIEIDVAEWIKGEMTDNGGPLIIYSPEDCRNPLAPGQSHLIFVRHQITTKCSAELLAFYNLSFLFGQLRDRWQQNGN